MLTSAAGRASTAPECPPQRGARGHRIAGRRPWNSAGGRRRCQHPGFHFVRRASPPSSEEGVNLLRVPSGARWRIPRSQAFRGALEGNTVSRSPTHIGGSRGPAIPRSWGRALGRAWVVSGGGTSLKTREDHGECPGRRTRAQDQGAGPGHRTMVKVQAAGPERRPRPEAQAGGPGRRPRPEDQSAGPGHRTRASREPFGRLGLPQSAIRLSRPEKRARPFP